MAKRKFAAGLLVLLSLLSSILPTTPAVAALDEVKWSRVNIPTEGSGGNWVLADGSDIEHLTMTVDVTLYAYANPSGTSYTLFKSTDGGYSWSYTGKVKDTIVDIATAPDDANAIYYATSSNIYRSTDAGSSFNQLPANPGGAGSDNVAITSIAVASLHDNNTIAVSTRDSDTSEFGGVYILDEEKVLPSWLDTNIGNYDVYAVAFSPNFPADRQLVAVVTDETETIVTSKVGDATWGTTIGDARLDKDNSRTPVAAANSADIAFPSDYDATSGDCVLFVAIDAGNNNGDVYMIEGADAPGSSTATDLDIGDNYGLSNIDVTTLAVNGSAATATMLAGAATSAQVYLSTDGGRNWTESTKPPTGQSTTHVLMASNFSSSGRMYAATSGTESAFSITQDGSTWNQVSLIDTKIANIIDLALSPNYSQDNTLFMLTRDGKYSLWRSLNGGTRWERVYSSTLPNVDSIKRVKLSPQYGISSQVVFLAGTGGGKPAIWLSKNNGQDFIRRIAHDPDTGDTLPIDTWAVVNDNTLFIGSFDGSNGLVYSTTDSGWSYSTGVVAGNQSLSSLVLSPSYEQDETILAGNTNGWVYWSNDNGTSFEPLPPDATAPPLTDSITVAFDLEFNSNNTVYAASNTEDKGIYRFIINKSTEWESIDSTLPEGGIVSQLKVSADGTLYATNLDADGGLERCLDPTYSLGPTFETVTRGLEDGATLTGLCLHDNRLWSIDTSNTRVMTFTDSPALPPTLTSPANNASGTGIRNVNLEWETLKGATKYEWQLDYDTDFSVIPTDFEDDTKASSARLPTLESATTYYWRVRAIEPVVSPWSTKWSFTTSLGSGDTAPQLESPEAGASEVPQKPVFQWSAVDGADSYELLVSTDDSFAKPIIAKIGVYALPSTAWQCDVSLDYDTTYYWKVRAIGSETNSDWSAAGAFTTEPPPSPPSSESTPPSPPASIVYELPSPTPPPVPPAPTPPQPDTPHWVIYLVGGLLLTTILLLIIVLVLVTGIRRL